MTLKTIENYKGYVILEDTERDDYRYEAMKDDKDPFNLQFPSVESVKEHIDRVIKHNETH